MAANPITYQEIEAFERKACVRFRAWEVDLLCRLDDAILIAARQDQATTPASQSGGTVVEMSNTKGVRDFMSVLAVKQNARIAAAKQRGR